MSTEGNSRNPEAEEVMEAVVKYYTRDIHTGLPAKIVKYDKDKQRADVKPLVKRQIPTADGSEIVESLDVISNVKVRWLTSGGFSTTQPVKVGDNCHILFCSYPIDKFMAGDGRDTAPEDFENHQLDSAVAVMGLTPFSKAIKTAESDAMVMGCDAGAQIHIKKDEIKLGGKDAGDKVVVESKLQAELNKLKAVVEAIKVDLLIIKTVPLVGNLGAPIPPPIISASASYSPAATASSLVSVKE